MVLFPILKENLIQYYRSNIVENLITDGTEFKNKKNREKIMLDYIIFTQAKDQWLGLSMVKSPHDYLIPIEEFRATSTAPTGSVEGSGGYSGGY